MTTTTAPKSILKDRIGFRPTADDIRYVETIANIVRAQIGAAFLSRSAVLRLALKSTAAAMTGTAS